MKSTRTGAFGVNVAAATLGRVGTAAAVVLLATIAGCQSGPATGPVTSGVQAAQTPRATEAELAQALLSLQELKQMQSQPRSANASPVSPPLGGDGRAAVVNRVAKPAAPAPAQWLPQPPSPFAADATTAAPAPLLSEARTESQLLQTPVQLNTAPIGQPPAASTIQTPGGFDSTLTANLISSQAGSLVRLLALRAGSSTGRARSQDIAALAILRTIEPSATAALDGLKAQLPLSAQRGAEAFAAIGAAIVDPAYDDTQLSDLLRRTAHSVSATPLTVSTVALATSVESFGRYAPINGDTFISGQRTALLVYAEVADFKNRRGEGTSLSAADAGTGGEYAVHLSGSIQLLSPAGIVPVINHGQEELHSSAKSPRREMFIARRIDIPATVGPGSYVLKITVRDEIGNSQVERTLPIHLTADPSLVGTRAGVANIVR